MNLERLKSVFAAGAEHLGDLIFWNLADARIDRASLEHHWKEAGLDVELLPDEPTAERALKLAVREAQIGQRDRLIRLGRDDEAHIVFAVVREHRDGEGNVTYVQEARVNLDRSTEVITSDDKSHIIVVDILAGFQLLRTTHTADDVRRSIVRALGTWAAMALRQHGGIYWVPAVYAAELRRLQTAIDQIGASRLHILPVHRSPDADRALGEIATASLETELAQLQAEIAAFLSTPPERASTLVRRLDAFEALRSRARLYRSVLNVQVLELDQALDHMAGTVETLLAQKQEAA